MSGKALGEKLIQSGLCLLGAKPSRKPHLLSVYKRNPAVKDMGLETDHTLTGTFTLCPDGPLSFKSRVYSFS